MLTYMPDLRTLSIPERRALAAEAERRARAGEAPGAIRAALGVSPRAYSSWAKLFGFRQCDLYPGAARPGFPPKHPPGPGGYARSGQLLCELPVPAEDGRRVSGPAHPAWRGGAAASRARYAGLRAQRQADAAAEVAAAGSARGVLERVRAALDAGDIARADRLLAAWRKQGRRAAALAKLEQLAAQEGDGPEPAFETLSEADKLARLSRQLGTRVSLRKPDGRVIEYDGPLDLPEAPPPAT